MAARHLSSQAMVKRRDRLALFSAILLLASTGANKTELMYRVGLSTAQGDKYIQMLVRSRLLEISDNSGKTVYRTTKKGKKFVDTFCTLVNLLD